MRYSQQISLRVRLKDYSINGIFENWKKIFKKSYVFGQIVKLILAKKKLRYQFLFVDIFFFH